VLALRPDFAEERGMTSSSPSSSRLATLCGFAAIGFWAALALLTTLTGRIPAFQLAAMTFFVAAAMGALSWLFRPGKARALIQPPLVWLVGVGGLFGFHALYFTALRLAPPAEAGLICYLWPLLIVVGAGLLPGEKLRLPQVLGALVGFAGVVVLIFGKGGIGFDPAFLPGYLSALGAAVAWAAYSLASRRLGAVPTDSVTGFCFATAVLSTLGHGMTETTVWPEGLAQWLAVIGLGLGPVGAAFFLWDQGMKHGDIRVIGFASYATPVLSTLLLVATGRAEAHWSMALACLMIAGGAALPGLLPRARSSQPAP
jgi:drug/metabolite transporter (DMT)-like permease